MEKEESDSIFVRIEDFRDKHSESVVRTDVFENEHFDRKKYKLTIPDEYYVYFAFEEAELIYIGQTYDLLNRMRCHRTYKRATDFITFMVKDRYTAKRIEKEAIKLFNPPGNIAHNPKRFQSFFKQYSHYLPENSLEEDIKAAHSLFVALNSNISKDVIDFMKEAALEKLKSISKEVKELTAA